MANDRREEFQTIEASFGKVLAALRKEQGMSQQELAKAIGYSLRYIGDLERGTKSATLRTMHDLATQWNTPLSSLLLEAEKEMNQNPRRICLRRQQ